MASGFGERDTGGHLSALGTVKQQIVAIDEGQGLSSGEQTLLEHALDLGLTAPDFFIVRKISEFAHFPNPGLLCLLLCEQLARSEGSTYLALEKKEISARLSLFGLDQREISAIIEKIPDLLEREPLLFAGDASRAVPFIIHGNRLYRHAHYVAEHRIANIVRRLLLRAWQTHPGLKSVFDEITRRRPLTTAVHEGGGQAIQLAREQALAALIAVHAPFTLISGGPGTGKTSVVVTILRLLAGLNVPMETVVLAAPTGRAANRLGESIQKGMRSIDPRDGVGLPSPVEPKTLHRLLGWSPTARRFRYDDCDPLDAGWIIVDECSMIDLFLMESLLTALKPEAHLILLGDAGQLPSVEAGAVFRDLSFAGEKDGDQAGDIWTMLRERIDARAGSPYRHRVRLLESFRQKEDRGGRQIIQIAHAMEKGEIVFSEGGPFFSTIQAGAPLPDEGVAHLDPAGTSVVELVVKLYRQYYRTYKNMIPAEGFSHPETDRLALDRLFIEMERLRVLCLTHGSFSGVTAVNRLFKEKFFRGEATFYPGLPWMVTRNDYRQGLYNGEIGIGLVFREFGDRQWLIFKGEQGYKKVLFETVTAPVLAFATTVHKSQGSEADHVVVLLPEQKNALCRREVIYTALTRARKSVLIHGKLEILAEAAAETMARVSGLRALISDCGHPSE